MGKFKKFRKFEIKGDEIIGGYMAVGCWDMCSGIDNDDVWMSCMDFCVTYNQ